MGILDTIKGLFKGREHQIKGGIDKVSDTLERKVPGQAERIDGMSGKAKDAVDKLGAEPGAPARAPATATTPSPTPTTPTTPTSATTTTTPSAAPTTPPASPPGTDPDPTPPPP